MDKIKYITIVMLMLFLSVSCEDLKVENENDPDFAKALASPNDVKGIAGGLINQWFLTTQNYDGPALALFTMADAGTCSWGNAGMRDLSSEPRIEYNNTPSYSNIVVTEAIYENLYATLASANDVLKQTIVGGVEINTPSETAMVNATAYFIQGLSLGYIGLLFDKGYIADENTDFATEEILAMPYTEIISKAVSSLDECIKICDANEFTLPSEWLPSVNNYTSTELGKLANSFAARILSYSARNKEDNDANDWNKILGYAKKGITFDFAPLADGDPYETDGQWYSLYKYYGTLSSWVRTDMRVINYMDPATPARWPAGEVTMDPSTSNDDRLLSDYQYMSSQNFRPERGDYHYSSYRLKRYDGYRQAYDIPLTEFMVAENDLIKAEALVRTNDLAGAANVINSGTRVNRGGLSPVSDDAQEILDAIEYESFVEIGLSGVGVQYFWMRKLDLLQPGTPLHFPIPASQLEVMELPFYSFGGIKGEPGVDYSIGGWE